MRSPRFYMLVLSNILEAPRGLSASQVVFENRTAFLTPSGDSAAIYKHLNLLHS